MGYYDDEKTAMKYLRMAEGYDGQELVDSLRQWLPENSDVLELGMGPGKDLALLARHFRVTGSDHSRFFLELYRTDHPDADLMLLNAVTLETERTFDAIFSNKVLHHLDNCQLRRSLERQSALLNEGGLICHGLWAGQACFEDVGLHVQYRSEDDLKAALGSAWEILELVAYTEMDRDDSLRLIARKAGPR